ncbi:putative bifunctional diguanylate cyclase/phosphodiesterase [Marinobacter orientalis]|uniref:cyclic-guanylate-specific phosphodiesterase n=1 Tax=Marinobacter orientalis TaxID=1928859 RepID=A0A7Y0REF7_9GAMM|nr:GGDEF domain-containing phosphodiesterase [Marinobacter orientalis]NMT64755.1 GGDEF and EAL domain-containing protein [Marinobacter orientalis]TGX48213.1 EAL domain-containing protein [Marinobacter orientalis]
MQNSFEVEHRLGFRVLRWVLAVALISGVLVSTVQVILDARRVSGLLDEQAEQTMALVRDASTQAVFSIDSALAQQVVDGLFAQEAIHLARITHPDGEAIGGRDRPLQQSAFRVITDPIFGAERSYRQELSRSGNAGGKTVYGYLELHYDTGPVAGTWLERASITFASGIAIAVILGLALFVVFHLLLTRPLLRIVQSVKQVDPDHPEDNLIRLPHGHQNDELGLWVNATNNLLMAIGDSQTRHREAEDRVNRLARYDQLTGLPSRDTFMELLQTDIEEAREGKSVLSLVCCGIDDFKSVNEQCGFRTGDLVLQAIADRLTHLLGGTRFTIARLGSDQFVIVEKGLRDGFQAANTADRILAALSNPMIFDDQTVTMTATLGIALFPGDAEKADRLLQSAEQTMALAKESGHNYFQFYVASIDREIRERKQLEKDLSVALNSHQFHLVYQPQINLETRRIIGAEALIRWQHPEKGLIPPDDFIPVSEMNGSIVEIGQWVLDQACRQAARWASDGMPLRIAVNLSAVQLRQDSIVDDILDTLERHNIPAGRLELEVTETSFMTNLEEAVDKLKRLRRAGISIAVDDFGTGYSSLTYLKRMPVQHLKIDKQFIRDLLVNEEDTRIANTIIDLGKSLNLSVVAEGVETAEQEYYLAQRGCQLAQGYFFSKPLKPHDFERFVASFHDNIMANNS